MSLNNSKNLFPILFLLLSAFLVKGQEPETAQKVVLVDIRGTSKSFVDLLLRSSVLDKKSAFHFLNQNSQKVSRIEPIPNAVTAVNSATLDTGVYPDKNGVIGNLFGRMKDGKYIRASGFGSSFLTETIWEKLTRQGKKVIRLGVLSTSGSKRSPVTIPTLPQVSPRSKSQVLDLVAVDCDYEFSKTKISKFHCLAKKSSQSETIELTFGRDKKTLKIIAVRGANSLIIDDDSNEKNGYLAKIKKGDWFDLVVKKMNPAAIGVYAKLLDLPPDLKQAKIYFAPAFQNRGFPASFVAEIEKRFGFAVGGPDWQGFLEGRIDKETVLEQAHRETSYMKNTALYSIKNLEFDYLMLDHPLLDRYGHYMYTSSDQSKNLSVVKDGYLATDKNISEILNAINKQNTSLMVVSGHGFSHTHTSFSIKELFKDLGFPVSPNKDAKISLFSSKVSAHVYLNDQSKTAKENLKIMRELKKKLLSYKAPNIGKKIFEKVLLRSEMNRYHLNNPDRSGDLWVSLRPGYTFDGLIAPDKLIGKSFFQGEHGYFDSSPEAKGVFYLYSSRKIKRKLKIKNIVDMAPLVYQLLEDK